MFVCAPICVGHMLFVFVQPVASQAYSGLQYWRISQCVCESLFSLFVNALFVFSLGYSHLANVCYDVGCVAQFILESKLCIGAPVGEKYPRRVICFPAVWHKCGINGRSTWICSAGVW